VTTWTVFNTGTPGLPNETDGPIAVSTGFTINDGGTYWCTGIEFFAATSAPTGVEVALWERNPDESFGATPGALLASEPAPGAITPGVRNQILFDTAVPVTAALFPSGLYATMRSGNNYVASGGTFSGGGLVNGPITAYQAGSPGANGRFKVTPTPAGAADSYPNTQFGGNGYWVSPIITDVDPGGPTDVEVADAGPGGARAGGSPAGVVIDLVVDDGGPRGSRAGGSPAALVLDTVVLDDGPRGARAGGSPAEVDAASSEVTILDRPVGARAGGSSATITTASAAVPDPAVWPMLVELLACVSAAADEVDAPPMYRQIRTGEGIQASISPTQDECCQGLAWVRPVQISPTNNFPTPESAWQNCPPGDLAVEVELGMLRCAPIMAEGSSDADLLLVTEGQWATTTSRVLADAAALRRAACCMIGKGYAVFVGSWSPVAVEANCAGGSMRITVAVPFCERTC
jgi:hypothetical protein